MCSPWDDFALYCQVCFSNDVFTTEVVWIADRDPNAQAESVGRGGVNLTFLKGLKDPVGYLFGMEG